MRAKSQYRWPAWGNSEILDRLTGAIQTTPYRNRMERFLIQDEFGQPKELIGEEIIISGYEELQFILHAWLYDKRGGWAITERSSGKRITSGPPGTEDSARFQLEQQLKLHGKEALMRVLGKGKLSS